MQKQSTRKASKKTPKESSDKVQANSTEQALEEECESILGENSEVQCKEAADDAFKADIDDQSKLEKEGKSEANTEECSEQNTDNESECSNDDSIEEDDDEPCASSSDDQDDLIDAKELGRRGEQAAVRFLERKGIEILERNWTCLAGEADIIAFDDEALRFVEVKTRTDVSKGFPSEAVTKKKRQRYEKIAALYLQESDFPECRVTFDVIAILVTGSHRAFLKYHRDAFAFDVAR